LHYLSNASSGAKMDRAAGARAQTDKQNQIWEGFYRIGMRQGGSKGRAFGSPECAAN
jgi:hypothetical protein